MSLPIDSIDISYAQPAATIDWKKVKNNIKVVMIRTGYGRDPDKEMSGHVAGAKSVGLPFGTYHYPIPKGDTTEARTQAEIMIEHRTKLGAKLAPAVDWEATKKESPFVAAIQQGDGSAAVKLADWIDAYMARADELLEGKCKAMMYTGSWFQMLPRDRAKAHEKRALWVASYTRPHPSIPWPWDEAALWQHSANTIWRLPNGEQAWGPNKPHADAVVIATPGKVEGVPGEVDCNAFGPALHGPLETGLQARSPLDLANVRDRQRALRRLGWDPGGLDGQWGDRSTRALKRAQAALNLRDDGVWGPITASAVESALAK